VLFAEIRKKRLKPMQKEKTMVDVEKSSGNVYADLGLPDAEEMLGKARLAAKIGAIIVDQRPKLTP